MKVCIIGAGYVGLVTGACFAEIGHHVICMDRDAAKIEELQRGTVSIHEPGLDRLIAANRKAGKLNFTNSMNEAAASGANAFFITVGTPTRPEDGGADLTHVYSATNELVEALWKSTPKADFVVLIAKSTVPVGTCREIKRIASAFLDPETFAVASNPEFLREGNAIADFMAPDRIVVGVVPGRARQVLDEIYGPLVAAGTPLIATSSVETAELIKYAANTFLATKISFINEVARLCEKIGADVEEVADGIGLDKRIGRKFLKAGPGFGGSCFPKDTLALIKTANDLGSPVDIAKAVVGANNSHIHFICNKIRTVMGGSVAGKRVAILGLSFKAGTNDMRNAASLRVIPVFHAEGAILSGYDPVARPSSRQILGGGEMLIAKSLAEAVAKTDAAVILTEWPEFRAAGWPDLAKTMSRPLLIDFRNLFSLTDAHRLGVSYYSLGRPSIELK